jgi:hypothetical protein
MNDNKQFRPLFLVKPKSVSEKDIRRVERLCGICMVECAEPEMARYSEPPLGANLDEQARAALSLLRMVLRSESANFTRGELTRWFVDKLINGGKVQNVPPVKADK